MRYGLAEKLSIICSICDKSTEFNTSLKVISSETSRSDVNIRSVYAVQTIGGLQRSGLQTFCNIMDLPPPIANINFNNVSKVIAKSAKDAAKCILKEAGERLLAVIVEKYPENICSTAWENVMFISFPKLQLCMNIIFGGQGSGSRKRHCQKTSNFLLFYYVFQKLNKSLEMSQRFGENG